MAAHARKPPLDSETPSTLANYVAVLRRRRWVALSLVLASLAASALYSSQQSRLFEAASQVVIARQNLANQLTGTPDSTSALDFPRELQTQASLARAPEVAESVVRADGDSAESDTSFLNRSSVTVRPNTSILEFRVRDPDRLRAAGLASLYADTYTKYRERLDTASIRRARTDLESEIARVRDDENDRSGALLSNLLAKDQQLRTIEALQAANASVVHRPESAKVVQPRVWRNLVIALLLGLVIAVAGTFALDALDTRVRRADEVEEHLDLRLLGRIPKPQVTGVPGLTDPQGFHSEAIRALTTNLQFATFDIPVRRLMITSALRSEGKSTTIASLAVALSKGGRDVVLVDLDLRRPRVDELFSVPRAPGVSEVLVGNIRWDEAVHDVSLPDATAGRLRVMAAGTAPPNPGELIASSTARKLLEDLDASADLVLVDAPPILSVGDAMAISAMVDGVLVITKLGTVRRPLLAELRRVLSMSPARPVGYAITNAERDETLGYQYGYGYGYGYSTARSDD